MKVIGKTVESYPALAGEWHAENDCSPSSVPHGSHKRALWRCSDCGHSWYAVVKNRTRLGSGCPQCWKVKGSHAQRGPCVTTLSDRKAAFLEKAVATHGDRYDYSQVKYTDGQTPVDIVCVNHGVFMQRPADHQRGYGCPSCISCVERFIESAELKYGTTFDYSKVVYKDCRTPVLIRCEEHGPFWQSPYSHLHASIHGCYECGRESQWRAMTRTTAEFIEQSRTVHGDKWDYSKTVYSVANSRVVVICPQHGEFLVRAINHISQHRSGCPTCNANNRFAVDSAWVERAIAVHGSKYDYSESIGCHRRSVIVGCPKHGKFTVIGARHMNGRICPKCVQSAPSNTLDFIEKAASVHGSRYDYSGTVYIKATEKVAIRCPKHGTFTITPHAHLASKAGCQVCRESKGEKAIRVWLEQSGLRFSQQWKTEASTPIAKCRFDFSVWHPTQTLVEFHGKQHYQPHSFQWSMDKGPEAKAMNLEVTQERDERKRQWCVSEGIPLVVIPYWEMARIPAMLAAALTDDKRTSDT